MKPRTKAAYEKARQLIPEQLLEALQLLGMKRRSILASFVNYHLETGFLNHIEHYLKKQNRFGLTREEAYAIWGYTTHFFYRELNALLRREGFSARTLPISKLIISGLRKLPLHKGPAYRQFHLDPDQLADYHDSHSTGKTVSCWQFLSCGSNSGAAGRGKTGRNIVEFYPKINATDISDLADGVRYRAYPPKELLSFPPRRFWVNDLIILEENLYISMTEIELK